MVPLETPRHGLSPSEIVVLDGERFAQKTLAGNIELLNGGKVSAAALGQAALLVAFLACREAGEIAVELREKRRFLGIQKAQIAFAQPTGAPGEWPDGCPEKAIGALARTLEPRHENDIQSIVYAWLEQDSGNPWKEAVGKIYAGMAGRGLLETRVEQKLRVFTEVKYSLPATTAALKEPVSADAVLQLIASSEADSSGEADLLRKHIKKAVQKRTDQD